MEITGTQTIAAPRQRVWDALNDPETLKKSLPGCESVERTSADEFKVIMAAAIGPLRARFNGVLKMSDIQAPASCTMVFEGHGGAIGFGKGNSSVKLTESNGQTEINYTAEAQVGGKLAQVGSRLIDSVARKMANDFFAAFKEQLAGGPGQARAAGAPVETPRYRSPSALATDEGTSSAPQTASAAPLLSTPALATPRSDADSTSKVMVPGWWLAVSAVIGSVATLAGALLAR